MSSNKIDRKIEILDDKEHALRRPNVYIGSVKIIREKRYVVEDGKFKEVELDYVPGLVKIFEEILDNSVDAFVDNNFEGNPKIKIELNDYSFKVTDNGVGIPNIKHFNKLNQKEEWMCESAWGTLKAGSNFDDKKRKSAGANGMGAALTNFFSKLFIGKNRNSGIEIIYKSKNNASDIIIKEKKTNKTGVEVYVEPDFSRFEVDKFTDNEKLAIVSRIYMLALTYPEIKFVYNGKTIKLNEIEF